MELPLFYNFLGVSRTGREAKEKNIFFVAQSSTPLNSGLAEGLAGLRRLAARLDLTHGTPEN